MGKTVTTELGSMHPRKTRNPHDLSRTPGGSSSGSAAAVAAGMVALAIGTQTNGSVIRPASFCGVVGFKPSFGTIPRTGILPQAPSLDTVGVFARTVEDAALLADALAGHDPADSATQLVPPPRLLETARTDPPVTPAIAFVKGPAWNQADPETQEGFAELADSLGAACEEVVLPEMFDEAARAALALMRVGIARHYRSYLERGREQLSNSMREAIEDGLRITAVDHMAALDWQPALNAGLEQLFGRYDAIVTPAAPGEAPAAGLDRQSVIQYAMVVLRRSGDLAAALAGTEWPAGRRSACRTPWRGCAASADSALADPRRRRWRMRRGGEDGDG